MTCRLPSAAEAWASDTFAQRLKLDIERLPPGSLPLDGGVAQGGRADDSRIVASVLRYADAGGAITATVGIFFEEIVAGCSCGDDPQSVPAYCEIEVHIDKDTALARFALAREDTT